MNRHLILAAGALGACLSFLSPAIAQDATYKLLYLLKPDKGEQFWMPLGFFSSYPDCLDGRSTLKVGKRIPKGVFIMADGRSPAVTVVDVKCKLSSSGTGN